MLASYLLDATRSSHPLEELALEHAGYKALREEDVCGRGAKAVSFAETPGRARARFRRRTRRPGAAARRRTLRELLRKDELDALYDELELPLIPVLVDIERAGVRVDTGALPAQSRPGRSGARIASRRAIYELAGEEFNINSPKKLSEILFDKLGLRTETIRRTTKTKAQSTAFEVLEELALTHELPRLILEWRGAAEAQRHLHRRAAAAGQPADRARAHLLQPGGRRDRPAEQQRSEPAEHPDPHRDRPRDSPRVRRRTRQRADLRRLLADRAARAGAPVGRRGADRRVRARRRHPRSHGGESLRRTTAG